MLFRSLYGPDRTGLPSAIVVESESWHIGVIGIVASRLVERYGRPAFVIGMDGEVGKGSGRSVRGVDLGAAANRPPGWARRWPIVTMAVVEIPRPHWTLR